MKLLKKNKLIKELFTKKYQPRIIKPKKGKGSFKRKKNKLNPSSNFLNYFR
tara:strand:- start:342 stop:494 length:153 start_codon:yes stop_codon:yes gene_type:complete